MSEGRKHAVVFERSEDGYGAYVPDLPGCVAVGDDLVETETLIREAIALNVALMRESWERVPPPTTLAEYVEVSLAVAQ